MLKEKDEACGELSTVTCMLMLAKLESRALDTWNDMMSAGSELRRPVLIGRFHVSPTEPFPLTRACRASGADGRPASTP